MTKFNFNATSLEEVLIHFLKSLGLSPDRFHVEIFQKMDPHLTHIRICSPDLLKIDDYVDAAWERGTY